jgi:hypothetical protein
LVEDFSLEGHLGSSARQARQRFILLPLPASRCRGGKRLPANGCGRRRIGAAARFGDGVPNAQTLSTRPPFARAEFANENGRMAAPAEW